nr:hypothetical protein [uncultured Holophaga sp.]
MPHPPSGSILDRSWQRAWTELGLAAPEGLQARLQEAYSEPHRRYHTLGHLEACLSWAEDLEGVALHPAERILALWFHDACYGLDSHDNEARSAGWAGEALAGAGATQGQIQRVRALIMATAHGAPSVDPEEQLIADLDLAILGAEPQAFATYEAQIRAEYGHVPRGAFDKARADILRSFLTREPLYQTTFFRERLEAQARLNLRTALQAYGSVPSELPTLPAGIATQPQVGWIITLGTGAAPVEVNRDLGAPAHPAAQLESLTDGRRDLAHDTLPLQDNDDPPPTGPGHQGLLDGEHLRLLGIGYLISGGLCAACSLLGGLYMLMGAVVLLISRLPSGGADQPPPALLGGLLMAMGTLIFVVLLSLAALKFYAARCLKHRRRRSFCLVVAGLSCLEIPYGTAIGILSFMVLGRASVRKLFAPGDPGAR